MLYGNYNGYASGEVTPFKGIRDKLPDAEVTFAPGCPLAEKLPYPACAKYYLGLEGVDIGIYCRCMDHRILKKDQMMQMEQLYRLNQMIADNFF